MTDKNIEEAKVGSGTAVTDKSAEKRAQISLKMIQLRMKQNKEREALAAQRKSLQKEETMTESFSASQIAALKAEYSKINTIDPASDTYKKLIAMLDRLDLKSLQSLAGAEIKFVSKLAQNRVLRKSMKKEEVQIDELSTNKLADYKKKAGADASAADKAGDIKKGNKRFSGIMKATRKQFDNDAKQKTEELSPKQKAMDKNKNGKIDGFDLSHLRKKNEELSPKQKELDKNKNGKIDGTDLAHLRSKKKQPQGADFAAQRRKERLASNGRMDEAKSDYEVYHKDYSGAVQAAIKQAEKRGFEVDMDDWHDKVATGPKKPSSGKTNSFSVKLKKDGKESKKALHLQVYNMDNHKYELNMYIEEIEQGVAKGLDEMDNRTSSGDRREKRNNSPEEKAKQDKEQQKRLTATSPEMRKKLRLPEPKQGVAEEVEELDELNKDTLHSYAKKSEKDQDDQYNKIGRGIRDKDPKSANKAGHKFSMRSIGQNRAEKRLAKEAASPAQQAAIAIAMKKAGKKPKMSESIVDKIKAIKRGMQAKDKADDHWDKAGDPKNPDAKKDLKKAVRYTNLLNKEEVVVTEAKKKSWKDMRKKTKNEEAPNKATVKKGDDLSGKREPIEINPELKEPAR
jgi:hypothetical protein